LGDEITIRPLSIDLQGNNVNCEIDGCDPDECIDVIIDVSDENHMRITSNGMQVTFKDKKSCLSQTPSWIYSYCIAVSIPKKFMKTK
jgi:hypothetical protein